MWSSLVELPDFQVSALSMAWSMELHPDMKDQDEESHAAFCPQVILGDGKDP